MNVCGNCAPLNKVPATHVCDDVNGLIHGGMPTVGGKIYRCDGCFGEMCCMRIVEQEASKVKTYLADAFGHADKVAHASGATSSHFSPFNFFPTYEGAKLMAARFKAGNAKHEDDNPVYSESNWLKAVEARDVAFFRDRAGHALEHLIAEMRGQDDNDPGGNIGAAMWFCDVMAYVKKHDPFLYGAIQGKWNINNKDAEDNLLKQEAA